MDLDELELEYDSKKDEYYFVDNRNKKKLTCFVFLLLILMGICGLSTSQYDDPRSQLKECSWYEVFEC